MMSAFVIFLCYIGWLLLVCFCASLVLGYCLLLIHSVVNVYLFLILTNVHFLKKNWSSRLICRAQKNTSQESLYLNETKYVNNVLNTFNNKCCNNYFYFEQKKITFAFYPWLKTCKGMFSLIFCHGGMDHRDSDNYFWQICALGQW
jgi:hypothetical protein